MRHIGHAVEVVAVTVVAALTFLCPATPANASENTNSGTAHSSQGQAEDEVSARGGNTTDNPFVQKVHFDTNDSLPEDFPSDASAQPDSCPTVQHDDSSAAAAAHSPSFSWVLKPTTNNTCTLTITGAGSVRPDDMDMSTTSTGKDWRSYAKSITDIVIRDGSAGGDPLPENVEVPLNGAFSKLPFVTSIRGLGNLNSGGVANMKAMFEHDPKLVDLNLSGFRTDAATDMDFMFHNDRSLRQLDLRQIDTSHVTSMKYTFAATALTSFAFADLNTSSVTSMFKMLHNEPYLTLMDMHGSTTGNVTDMSYIFEFDNALASVSVAGLDTRSLTTMEAMFAGSSALTRVDLAGMYTGRVVNMRLLFCMCSSLPAVDVSSFDTSQVTNMHSMFEEMDELTGVTFGDGFDTGKVKTFDTMFQEDSKLTPEGLDLGRFNTSAATDMRWMFAQDPALTSLDLSGFDTGAVRTMVGMFRLDSGLESLEFGQSWSTGNVTSMADMFAGCSALTDLDLSRFDTGKVTDMRAMFSTCSALASLDLSGFDTGAVTTFAQMFDEDKALKALTLGDKWDTGQATSMFNMFHDLYLLSEVDVSTFDTSNVTDMQYMFGGCRKLSALAVSHFDTSKVTDMTGMFKDCYGLKSLGPGPNQTVLPWNTSSVTSITDMFNSASTLTSLDLSSFDTSHVTGDMHAVFASQGKLESLTLGDGFDMRGVTGASGMFYADYNLRTLTLGRYASVPATANAKTMFFNLSGTWAEVDPHQGNDAWSGGWSGLFGLSPSQAATSGATGDDNPAPRYGLTKYVRGSVAITFEANNSAIGSDASSGPNSTLPLGHTLKLDYTGIPIAGQVVTSWNTKPDGTGNSYRVGSQYSAPTKPGDTSLMLYAQWQHSESRLPFTGGMPWQIFVLAGSLVLAVLTEAQLVHRRRTVWR